MTRSFATSTSGAQRWFFRSGWFLCLLVVGGSFYFSAIKQKKQKIQELTFALHLLEDQRNEALKSREELQLYLHSLSDPAWVEMVLKRNLGLISEGQTKVYFE